MFNPQSLAQKGNYKAGKNLTKKEFNKLRTKFGQTQKTLQKKEKILQMAIDNKAPPREVMNKRRDMNKAKGKHAINQRAFEQALYDKKLYRSSNEGLKTLGLGAAGLVAARQAYKHLNKPKLSRMQKLKKRYAAPVLGVGGLSGLSYLGTLGTEKTSGEIMNPKHIANTIIRSKEVGVSKAMDSFEKKAYSRGEGTMLTERPIYELGEDELKRRLAYERGETGLRSLMGGLGVGALGALQGGAVGGGPGALGGLVAGGLLGAGGGYLSSKLRELEAAREYKRRKSYKARKELEDFKRKGKTKTANKKLLAAGAGLGALGGLAGYSASDKGAGSRGTAAGVIGGGAGGLAGAIGGGALGGAATIKTFMKALKKSDPKAYKRIVAEAGYDPVKAGFFGRMKRKMNKKRVEETRKNMANIAGLGAIGATGGAALGTLGGTVAGGMFGGATAGRRDAAKEKMTSQKRSRKYEDYK